MGGGESSVGPSWGAGREPIGDDLGGVVDKMVTWSEPGGAHLGWVTESSGSAEEVEKFSFSFRALELFIAAVVDEVGGRKVNLEGVLLLLFEMERGGRDCLGVV